MKRISLLLGGVAFLGASAGFAFLLLQYLMGGSGLQFILLPGVNIATVLIGWVHVIGLGLGCLLCFVLGAWCCAEGLVVRGVRTKHAPPKP